MTKHEASFPVTVSITERDHFVILRVDDLGTLQRLQLDAVLDGSRD